MKAWQSLGLMQEQQEAKASDLLAGSVPHDDLAIVASSCDDLWLQGIALKAKYFVWGLQNKLGMDRIPEVPD